MTSLFDFLAKWYRSRCFRAFQFRRQAEQILAEDGVPSEEWFVGSAAEQEAWLRERLEREGIHGGLIQQPTTRIMGVDAPDFGEPLG